MAVLVKEFIDFETNELQADADPFDFAGAVGGSCSLVTTPAPPYGTYTLKIEQHKTNSYFRSGLFTYTASTTCITSFYVYFGTSNFPPSFNCNDLCTMEDESNGRYWEISLTTIGALELRDNADTLLDNFSPSAGGWYRIEVVWEPGNASGDWAWYIVSADPWFPVFQEGTAAHGGTKAQADFLPAGPPTDIGFLLRGQGGDPDASPMTTYFGGGYIIQGAKNADTTEPYPIEDRVGGREGKSGDWHSIGSVNGKIILNSATPDCDETGNAGSGDDVTSGTPSALWKYAGDDDLATECVYTRAPGAAVKGGGCKVAAPVSDPSDVVVAAKWIWYGKGTGFNVVFGNYNPDADFYVVTNEDAAVPVGSFRPTDFRYWRKILDRRDSAPNYDPTYDEQFVTGMFNDHTFGKVNIVTTLAEAWCYSLHAVPALTGKPSIGRFGNAWRGKKGRPL